MKGGPMDNFVERIGLDKSTIYDFDIVAVDADRLFYMQVERQPGHWVEVATDIHAPI